MVFFVKLTVISLQNIACFQGSGMPITVLTADRYLFQPVLLAHILFDIFNIIPLSLVPLNLVTSLI